MGFSRYPRPGYRLAPSLLGDVLQTLVPKGVLQASAPPIKLCDLDETVWRFGDRVCKALAWTVVEETARQLSRHPRSLLDRTLPLSPRDFRLDDLELQVRTYNCLDQLRRGGLLNSPHDWAKLSIGSLLSLRAFGAKSLVDLLTSYEGFVAGKGGHASDRVDSSTSAIDYGRSLEAWTAKPLFPIPSEVLSCKLPKPAEGLRLADLPLQTRTYNCLEKHGFRKTLSGLGEMTVRELLKIRGFGPGCLVDLLLALFRKEQESPTACREDLADELDDVLVRNQGGRRNREIIKRYFGLDGKGGTTLREVGVEFGVTRARVQQICHRFSHVARMRKLALPLLESALELVRGHIPGTAEEIEVQLTNAGVCKQQFRLPGLLNAAILFGRKAGFTLEVIAGKSVALPAERVKTTKQIVREARRAIKHWGALTVADLVARLEERLKAPIEGDFALRVLRKLPEFKWLDEASGWFWLRTVSRSRILTKIRKILAVSGRIPVADLRMGIARHHRMKGYAPPRRVLLELCRLLPGMQVEGEVVMAKPPIDWSEVLSPTEQKMFVILMEHGPIMQRARFEERCLESGMKRSTFYVYLDYSPIIERYAAGVYGLRGAEVTPGEVESLIPTRRATSVRLDHGWTPHGEPWISYRLSEATIQNGVVSVPPGFKQLLEGEFDLKTADGHAVGKLVVKESSAWGLGPFFRRRGGEEGDHIMLVLSLTTRQARISIGDEAMIEQFGNRDF